VFINYLAIDDNRVIVGNTTSSELGSLEASSGERSVSIRVPFNWSGKAPATVAGGHFLIGARFAKGNWSIAT